MGDESQSLVSRKTYMHGMGKRAWRSFREGVSFHRPAGARACARLGDGWAAFVLLHHKRAGWSGNREGWSGHCTILCSCQKNSSSYLQWGACRLEEVLKFDDIKRPCRGIYRQECCWERPCRGRFRQECCRDRTLNC